MCARCDRWFEFRRFRKDYLYNFTIFSIIWGKRLETIRVIPLCTTSPISVQQKRPQCLLTGCLSFENLADKTVGTPAMRHSIPQEKYSFPLAIHFHSLFGKSLLN